MSTRPNIQNRMKTLNNIRGAGCGWVAAVIGVLGILGGPRQLLWANDIGFRETIRGTDYTTAGVGGLRNTGRGTITLRGMTGAVTRAWLYWAGPSNATNSDANASITFDGRALIGQPIGTTSDNCWGYWRSFAYRADVTEIVAARRNGAYLLAGMMKQGTNVNANGASLLVFHDDGITNNNRDIVLYDGNDSNAPNVYDALDWNVNLRNIRYTNGLAKIQLHVSDGQSYRDAAVLLNGRILASAGGIFSGVTCPSANNGPLNNGNLWDIKNWDVTRFLGPGTNYLRLNHGYLNTAGDCLSLIVAVINLPAGAAPPPDRQLTNHAPSITAEAELTFNTPQPVVVEARVEDIDGDALTTAISVNSSLMYTGGMPGGAPPTTGMLALTNAYPLGTNLVLFAASDGDLSGSHLMAVRIIDDTPPDLIVPANIVTTTDPGSSTVIVTFIATATDDFGPVSVSCAPPSGYAFPIGATRVNCSAVDGAGNIDRDSFLVTVLDGQPPLIHCPADIIRPAAPGTNVAIVTYTVTARDTDTNLVITCTPPSGSLFPMGTNAVTCVARDSAGNTSQCGFNVIILDMEPPIVTPPTNMIVANDLGQCSAVVHYIVRMTDNMPGATLVCTPPSGSTFPFGTTLVTCIGTDSGGNRSTNFFRITVIDAERPVLSLPADQVIAAAIGGCSAVATYTATATDNCSVPTVSCTPRSGVTFNAGTNLVRCTATDAAGNTSSGSFKVVVLDTEPPVIRSITPTNKVLWPPNHKMIPITYSVVATDNCGPVTSRISAITSNQPADGNGDGHTTPDYRILGNLSVSLLADLRSERDGSTGERIYTITIESRDRAGNTATRNVYVRVPKSGGGR